MFPKPKKHHCGPSTAGDREKEGSHQVEDKGEMIKGIVHPGPGTEFILVVETSLQGFKQGSAWT